MSKPLNLLLLEDSKADAELILCELRRGGYEPSCKRVETAAAMTAALDEQTWDVVLADYHLPQFSAPQALTLLKERGLDLPFIVVSGAIGERTAIEMMKAGAHDYFMKDQLARLAPAIERELREAQGREERRRAELQFAALSSLGQKLSSAKTAKEAAEIIMELADQLFGWDACAVDLYSAEQNRMHHVLNGDTINGRRVSFPPAYDGAEPTPRARRVIEKGAQLILREEPGDNSDGIPFGDTSHPSAAIMLVPLRDGSKVIGILSIQSYTPKAYGPRDLEALQSLADHCGGALNRIQAEDEVRKSREQLRALAAGLQASREEERSRISRELHDELGEVLTGIKLGLTWMRNRLDDANLADARQQLLEKIAAIGDLADGTANRVRKLCTNLRPSVLDDLGLVPAIEWQVQEFQKRTNIRCEAKMKSENLTATSEQATAIFRIFQEILTNVARHAQASKVRVRLQEHGSNLMLEVKDNGRGIKPEEIAGSKSLELLGMQERAALLGGKVIIRGKPGSGTVVSVTIPVAPLSKDPREGDSRDTAKSE